MTRRFLLLLACCLAAAATSAIGQLAPGLVDADGDLVADPPVDPAEFKQPKRLIFAYTPVEDPAIYRDVWVEFLAHLEEKTGRKVEFFAVQSNAAQLEAMRAGRLHIAAFNTGSTPVAVNACGFVPFAMMADSEGKFGYEMEIIVPADSPVQTIADLKGRKIAFTSPTSNSGYKAPSVLLSGKFGLEADRDYTPAFSGKHDNSVLGVAHGDYDAAAIANSVLARMIARGTVDASEVRQVYQSESFPTSAYGYVHNLDPALAAQIREAFFSFDWQGTGLEKEFGAQGETQFIPLDYRANWQIVRDIDAAMGVRYEIE